MIISSISNWINANQDMLSTLVVALSVFMIYFYKKRGTRVTNIAIFSCVIYIFLILYKTVFSRAERDVTPIFDFGWSYRAALANTPGMFSQIYLNILLYIPLGCFSETIFVKRQKLGLIFSIMIGLAVTLTTEHLQLFLQRGSFEFDDIVNNMIGILIGASVAAIINHSKSISKEK